MSLKKNAMAAAMSAVCLAVSSFAAAQQSGPKFASFIMENDVVFQEDGGYTNGIALALGKATTRELNKSNTAAIFLPLIKQSHIDNYKNRRYATTYFLGHGMNTPEDITQVGVIKDEQPYSGVLLSRINFYSSDGVTTDRLGLYLGIVGPVARAEQGQRYVHKITDGTDPKGWHNQLKNEPVFKLETARSRKLIERQLGQKAAFELISSVNGGLGNLSSDVGMGLGFRFGTNLSLIPSIATGVPGREINPIALSGKYNWYFFAEVLGKYVFNDITIDGNTFADSHSVDLVHEQAQLSYGFAINFGRVSFGYTSARSTKIYETQPLSANFGAINFTFLF